MTIKEKVVRKINFLTDEQIESLYSLLNSFYPEETPNEETLAALKEAEDIKKNPEQHKSFSSVGELFKELNE